jgi:diguanylate cyclase (GGDEF)-like protein/PAS domain S-box-containing protein
MFKYPILRNGFFASVLLVASLPLYNIFIASPAFSHLSIHQVEAEAIRIGNYMAAELAGSSELSDEEFLQSTKFTARVQEVSTVFGLLRYKIFKKDGTIVQASRSDDIGVINTKPYFLDVVAKGGIYTKTVTKNKKSLEGDAFKVDIMETYVPIFRAEKFIGAFEVYLNITQQQNSLNSVQQQQSIVLIVIGLGMLILISAALQLQAKYLDQEKAAERKIRENEERMSMIMHTAMDAIVTTNDNGIITTFNKAAEDLFDYKKEEMIGCKISDMVVPPALHHENGEQLETLMKTFNEPVINCRFEIVGRKPDGSPVDLEIALTKGEHDSQPIVTIFMRDITEVKQIHKKITYMANHDTLTGLANRHLLSEMFNNVKAKAKRNQSTFSILNLDLDNFKPINDTLGHHIGDKVLQTTAKRLKALVRESDLVARVGGDEFVLLLDGLSHKEDASRIAQNIIESLSLPCVYEDCEATIIPQEIETTN